MVWRWFRGRSSTTTTVTETKVDPGVAGEAAGASGLAKAAAGAAAGAAGSAAGSAAPRFGGFSFEAPRGAGAVEVVAAGADGAVDGATVEAPVPVDSSPTADMVAAVRRKAGRRGARAADRGVGPVLIPSLREQAILYRLAAEARAVDEPAATLGLWKAYLELCPADAEAWFRYGQCLLAGGHFDSAWGAFVETRRIQPTNGLAAGALGFLCLARGAAGEAVRHFEEAVALQPGSVEMLEALADAQGAAGLGVEAAATRVRVDQVRNGD